MKKNLFEMGANFDNDWSTDNRDNRSKVTPTEVVSAKKHQLYFSKEKRRGKVVTIIQPFYVEKATSQALLKSLKKRFSTGGTFTKDTLELQGDIATSLKPYLQELGYGLKKR